MADITEYQQTLMDVEAITQMWRSGLISEEQAVSDIQDQLTAHEEAVGKCKGVKSGRDSE